MSESDLIQKIRLLKQIRPRKDWALLIKRELFREEPILPRERFSSILDIFPRLFPNYRFALATLVFLGILISAGAVNLSQNSLPGDFLYSVKRISEKSQAVFVSKEQRPKAQLELANKRLEELTQIAEKNQVQKLAPAINEFKASLSQAAKDLRTPEKLTKGIVDQTKKLEENREKVKALGIVIGESEEFTNSLKEIVQREIAALENSILTENQEELLEDAKEDFESGNFTAALEKVWLISNQ